MTQKAFHVSMSPDLLAKVDKEAMLMSMNRSEWLSRTAQRAVDLMEEDSIKVPAGATYVLVSIYGSVPQRQLRIPAPWWRFWAPATVIPVTAPLCQISNTVYPDGEILILQPRD